MYADDTSVLLSGDDLKDLTCLLNKELELLFIWLKSNKLSLNTQKTFYMLFHRARIKGFFSSEKGCQNYNLFTLLSTHTTSISVLVQYYR